MYWAYELAIAKHCTHDGAYWCVETETFAKFDMTKGYWQLGLAPAVRMATAFSTWRSRCLGETRSPRQPDHLPTSEVCDYLDGVDNTTAEKRESVFESCPRQSAKFPGRTW